MVSRNQEMTMRIPATVVAAVLCAFTLPALAQGTTSTPRIDKRQANQERRIEQGEKSGQLTPREAARLERGQARVQKMENKAVADGKVTPRERAKIEKAQNRESRKIRREKHDAQHQ
jgi:uncharacterized membrane protein YebE (DUF533 family)